MIVDEKIIVLKDGRTCLLRSPQKRDAEKLLHYLQIISRETIFILRYPEEPMPSLEEEIAYIKNMRESENQYMISAFIETELIGTAQVNIHKRVKTRHRAEMAIGLIQNFWGLGIGGSMIDCFVQILKSRGCEQLELEVIQGNQRAISLYERKGFITYGERKRGIRLKDGSYLSEYLMYKDLGAI